MRPLTIAACFWLTAIGAVAQDVGRPFTGRQSGSWTAPASAGALQNPLANRPETLPGGRKVFEQRCSACHGSDGTGTSRGPNLTIRAVQEQSDGALFWKITTGNTRTAMPSFSFLPPLQRWQLVLYLRSL